MLHPLFMLDLAINYKREISYLMINAFNDPHYHYFRSSTHTNFDDSFISNSTWQNLQYVSVSNSLNVLGLMFLTIDRSTMNANDLGLISFKKNSIEFANDFASFICLAFGRFNIKKISWNVIVGSPHERTYDKLTKKHNGRIVGVLEKEKVLEDGLYYDCKLYELMKDNFIESIKGTRLENRSQELYNVKRSLSTKT